MHPKFIAITGGVLSGVGKGTITASIGKLLSLQGYGVSAIKIDPYINVDAGTMRPTEHGEVFVTDDGGETDQDLGTYERFIGRDHLKDQNMTTGQVYQTVIQKERNLEYKGRCVEVIPHIPEEVKRRIKESAERTKSDFCLIEVGGTVGDYQNVLFLEALRQMKLEGEKVLFIHVSYLPVPGNLGEMKTKPTQRSVKDLNSIGIQPDMIITRSARPIDDVRKHKISMFCNVSAEDVVSSHDVSNIYEVPLVLEKQDFTSKLLSKLGLVFKQGMTKEWGDFVSRTKSAEKEARVGIIGKYFDVGDFTLEDSYISVIEAVKHACWNNGFRAGIEWIDSKEFEKDKDKLESLRDYDALIVPGGFGGTGVEGKIEAIRYARENNIPFLGLCYGMQLAVVEFARNVCGMDGANSAEIDEKAAHCVIDIMPEQKKNISERNYGATMRLGAYPARLKEGSVVHQLYGAEEVSERHRHRYEVNPEYAEKLESSGLVFSGRSPDRRLMEFLELPGHTYFVATQAHPEFKSRPMNPAPLFDGLIRAIKRKV
ncbi:MAG: CTP synthase [Candidatus Woesearchaeota archaeon]